MGPALKRFTRWTARREATGCANASHFIGAIVLKLGFDLRKTCVTICNIMIKNAIAESAGL